MAEPVDSNSVTSTRDIMATVSVATVTSLVPMAKVPIMAEAMVMISITKVTTKVSIMVKNYSVVATALVVAHQVGSAASAATVVEDKASATREASLAVVTVVSDRATTSQTESLMMAYVATSVVLAVLLLAAASVDAVLMDVVLILSMTTVRSVASTQAVSSLLSSAISAILKILVVNEVSQALEVSMLILLKDQDSLDFLAEVASIITFEVSAMSVPIRTLAASVALVQSKTNAFLTLTEASKALTVLVAVMDVFVLALAASAVLAPASMAPAPL